MNQIKFTMLNITRRRCIDRGGRFQCGMRNDVESSFIWVSREL